MTDNIAVLQGFTKEVIAEYATQSLSLLIKPDTDIGEQFRAWDMDMQEFINVKGWLASFTEVMP